MGRRKTSTQAEVGRACESCPWKERAIEAERRLAKAEEVVEVARRFTACWDEHLDDRTASDEVKYGVCELSLAVWVYDYGDEPSDES